MKTILTPITRHAASLSVRTGALFFGAAACFASVATVRASSHSDAPLIKLDPQANLTDVYAFIRQRPNGERALVVEVPSGHFLNPVMASLMRHSPRMHSIVFISQIQIPEQNCNVTTSNFPQ